MSFIYLLSTPYWYKDHTNLVFKILVTIIVDLTHVYIYKNIYFVCLFLQKTKLGDS